MTSPHLAWMTSNITQFLNHMSKLCHLCLVAETKWTIATLMMHQLLGRHLSTPLGTTSLTHPLKVGLSFISLSAAMQYHFLLPWFHLKASICCTAKKGIGHAECSLLVFTDHLGEAIGN